jgi:hypothetical protein
VDCIWSEHSHPNEDRKLGVGARHTVRGQHIELEAVLRLSQQTVEGEVGLQACLGK